MLWMHIIDTIANQYLEVIINRHNVLDSPCIFCGYNGVLYWQRHSHKEACPWFEIGGGAERKDVLLKANRMPKEVIT